MTFHSRKGCGKGLPIESPAPSVVPRETAEPPPMNPTSKFSRIFDLLSLRDPTLNATLYEDEEFGGLLRDIYAALRPQDAKEAADAPKAPTPEEQEFRRIWDEARARVAPLVKEALDAERWGSARTADSRFRGGSGYYASSDVTPETPPRAAPQPTEPAERRFALPPLAGSPEGMEGIGPDGEFITPKPKVPVTRPSLPADPEKDFGELLDEVFNALGPLVRDYVKAAAARQSIVDYVARITKQRDEAILAEIPDINPQLTAGEASALYEAVEHKVFDWKTLGDACDKLRVLRWRR